MGDVVRLFHGRRKSGVSLPKPRDCEACEEPIEAARLQVMPHAKRCVSCQSARERRHSQMLDAMGDRDIAIIRG